MMNKSTKRILALVLSLVLLLSYLPSVPVTFAAGDGFITIEAENTEYATWNRYTVVESNGMYSGGAAAASAPSGIYPYWDNEDDSTEDLKANFLDKSNTPYVAFYVEAPAAGTYKIMMMAQILPSSSTDKRYEDTGLYYGAFYVNGKSYPALYENSSDYANNVKGKNLTTQEVTVELVKGINTIYCIGITEEQDYSNSNSCWSNIDCLMVQDTLTPVKAQAQVLYAADAPYVHNYNRDADNTDGMIGGSNWTDTTLPIDGFNVNDVDKYHAFTYTVTAPQDGYYDITATYKSAGNGSDTRAVGLLVDGVPYANEFKHLDNTAASGGKVDISVYLTAGDHVLTITAPAKRTADDTCGNNVSWFNYYELLLYGGLKESDQQATPQGWKIIEAENKDLTDWSGYGGTESDDKYSGGAAVANKNVDFISFADLQAGKLIIEDKTGCANSTFAPYVAFYVEAPADGAYDIQMQAVIYPSSKEEKQDAETSLYYGAFYVNGTAYKALYEGADNYRYDVYDDRDGAAERHILQTSRSVSVVLTKGLNVIYAFGMTDEQDTGDNKGWTNIDCLKIDSRLTYVAEPTKVTTATADQGVTNLYTNVSTGASAGGSKPEVPKNHGISIETLTTENLWQVPFVAYTVEAPADGYYEIIQHFGSEKTPENAAFGYMIDGQQAKAASVAYSPSKKVNLSTWLSKGTHTLVITLLLPKTAAEAASFEYGWVDMGKIHLHNLTLAAEQVDPLAQDGLTVLEAEEDAVRSYRYTKDAGGKNTVEGTDNVSGLSLKAVANMVITEGGVSKWSAEDVQTLASMQADGWLDKSMIPYLTYNVNAAAAGKYTIEYVYKPIMSGDNAVSDYFMTLSVNDQKENFRKIENVTAMPDGWYKGTVTVDLVEGRNVIRVMSIVGELAGKVTDVYHDYMVIYGAEEATEGEGKVSAVDGTANWFQSGNSAHINRFSSTSNNRLWAKPSVGGVDHMFMTYDALSSETLKELPYFAYTVEIPADGYYDMETYLSSGKAENSGYIILGIDGEMVKKTALDHTGNSLIVGVQNLTHYLTKGTHTILVSALCEPSVSGGWSDMGALTIYGADVQLAGTQIDPQTLADPAEGLIDGSVYVLDEGTVTIAGTPTVVMVRSNFWGNVTVWNGTTQLQDTDTVVDGAVIKYESGTSYTVKLVSRGDLDDDSKVDIRDLKIAKKYVLQETNTINMDAADMNSDGILDDKDLELYREAIFNGGYYQSGSMGADAILAYCNGVGRLINNGGALYMEASASNFTLTGEFVGDMYITVMHSHGINDENQPGFFVEIDGEETYYPIEDFYVKQTVKIASGLTAGEHTIKVSKSVDSKNGGLYVYSVSYHGNVEKAEESDRKIMFIGDSITAGFGVVTKSDDPIGIVNDGVYTNKTYSYYSYANVVSDLLGADYYSIANGGWYFSSSPSADIENKSITRILDLQSMLIDLGAYDASVWQPDVVVINLGTNDATLKDSQDNLVVTKDQYQTDIAALLDQVRAAYPNAKLVWAYGAMGHTGNMPDGPLTDWITAAIEAYNEGKSADMQVAYYDLPVNQEGLWSHPDIAGQQAVGEALAEKLASLMGWD